MPIKHPSLTVDNIPSTSLHTKTPPLTIAPIIIHPKIKLFCLFQALSGIKREVRYQHQAIIYTITLPK